MLSLLIVAAIASATPIPPPVPRMDPAVVARFVENMRDNITMGTLPDGTPLAPETPAERAQPILPPALSQRIFDRGLLTGAIEACGGDADKMSLDPLLAGLASKGLTPRQIGFAKLLHNAAREQTRSRGEEPCPPSAREQLLAQLKTVRAGD